MLTPTDNVAVASLSDLKDGVYTIQLSEERSICGPLDGPGTTIAERVTPMFDHCTPNPFDYRVLVM